MYSIGIDIGYSSVNVVLVEKEKIIFSRYKNHRGQIKKTLLDILHELSKNYNLEHIKYGAVTGNGSKFLLTDESIKSVNDVTAVIEGAIAENIQIGSIVDIGGESARFITGLNGKDMSRLEMSMNSNCSSGTGSFLEEQMSRLNLNLADYTDLASKAKSIPRIAGRCSVFAKTDITHHQQEGVAIPDILLGLAYALVKNYRSTIIRKLVIKKPVFFSGGVAYNGAIITALKDLLSLSDDELIFPENIGCTGALGTAVMAVKDGISIDLQKVITLIKCEGEVSVNDSIKLPKLSDYGSGDSVDKHIHTDIPDGTDCYLGIDIGSTSTNLVLVNKNKEIVSSKYLRTFGNPIEAVRKGFSELKAELGDRVNIVGAGTTGSGRYMIGKMIGADVVKDEITAQAEAAVAIDNGVDTIFEIGGQDSKFISIKDGAVVDFQMNKICAAGTGSFIEEQAKKFNIAVEELGDIALRSQNPLSLGERCTVFIEGSIAAYLSKGAKLDDIVSGLCYSIVKNYLDRVVGQKKIGNKIFFQGGLAHNQGVINAFRAVTGKEIIVPPFFSVTGAYGVAIFTMQEMAGKTTAFKGFDIESEPVAAEKSDEKSLDEFNKNVEKIVFSDYKNEQKNTKTVGIPRALFTFGLFSMFNTFFQELGFNVVLSDPTDEKIIAAGQEYAMDETCYPVKLITGHVAELVKKNVDYIFFPDLITVDHPGSASRKNYGCAFMQLAFKVMNHTMELDKKGITLLSPTIAFHMGKESIMKNFLKTGLQLGKTQEQTKAALEKGLEAAVRFEERLAENSRKVMSELKSNEIAFVMISKIYGVADPAMNMGIPKKLSDMGYKVFSFYDLPDGDISKEHPNMFWPFGQHILEPAQLIRRHPNLYAVLLTHHGCGPDSVLSHYFREEMDGKPYLHIEIDEHSSGVGITTRVEAFVNSLKNVKAESASDVQFYIDAAEHKTTNIVDNLDVTKTVYLPYMYPYSDIYKEILLKQGINARVLPASNNVSVDAGRRFTITEEYFSLTALLGNVFTELSKLLDNEKEKVNFLIPQNEGTETDGQYSRLLRTKLDEEGLCNVGIISPFWEDLLKKDEKTFTNLSLCLVAGDLILTAPQKSRTVYLNEVLQLIRADRFSLEYLKQTAVSIKNELNRTNFKKTILAIGEYNILCDDFLNNYTFKELEDNRHRVLYSPFGEAVWMMWKDYVLQNKNDFSVIMEKRLQIHTDNIYAISNALSVHTSYEKDLDDLIQTADETIGYFSGAYGRYRQAKQLGKSVKADGIISVASIYENTGIVLGLLRKGFENEGSKPSLNLTFDGNQNENDAIKINSFMYYL